MTIRVPQNEGRAPQTQPNTNYFQTSKQDKKTNHVPTHNSLKGESSVCQVFKDSEKANMFVDNDIPPFSSNSKKIISEAQRLNKDIYDLIEKSRKMVEESQSLFSEAELRLVNQAKEVNCYPKSQPSNQRDSLINSKPNIKVNINPNSNYQLQPNKNSKFKESLLTESSTIDYQRTPKKNAMQNYIDSEENKEDISLNDIIDTFDRLHQFTNNLDTKFDYQEQPLIETNVTRPPGKDNYSDENKSDIFENFEKIERDIKNQFQKDKMPTPEKAMNKIKISKLPYSNTDKDDTDDRFEALKNLINNTKSEIQTLAKSKEQVAPRSGMFPPQLKSATKIPRNKADDKDCVIDEEEQVKVLDRIPMRHQQEVKKRSIATKEDDDVFSLNLFQNIK